MMGVKGKYPVKTTINLAQRERRHKDLGSVIPTAVVLAVAIAAFCKFGVIDRLAAVSDIEAQARAQGELLSAVQARTAGYDEVLEEYQSFVSAQSITGGGADPMECLALVEEELIGRAQVESLAVAPDTITVKLSGVTLNDISDMHQRLTASELVAGVQVYTAATDQEKDTKVTAALTIRLAVALPEEEAQG